MKLNEVASQDTYIHDEMKKLEIENYTIRNGKVDVEGDVAIPENYTSIPIPFGHVSGNFYLPYCRKIESLHNSPIEVGGRFWCHNTGIKSLKGAPREVGMHFSCSQTDIETLEGAPRYVGGNFDCGWNDRLISLKGAPREVGGHFRCNNTFKEEPDHSFIKIDGNFYWSD